MTRYRYKITNRSNK